jgi:ATP-binding cassette subfamily F protein 2
VPKHLDIFFLKKEIDPTEMTALEAVLDVDDERKRLEAEVRVA